MQFLNVYQNSGWKNGSYSSRFSQNFKYFTNKGGDIETLSQMCKITLLSSYFDIIKIISDI
jgi:hypothetical protein